MVNRQRDNKLFKRYFNHYITNKFQFNIHHSEKHIHIHAYIKHFSLDRSSYFQKRKNFLPSSTHTTHLSLSNAPAILQIHHIHHVLSGNSHFDMLLYHSNGFRFSITTNSMIAVWIVLALLVLAWRMSLTVY